MFSELVANKVIFICTEETGLNLNLVRNVFIPVMAVVVVVAVGVVV